MENIKQGSTVDLVNIAQKLLNTWGYYLPLNGIFDEMMYFAVIDFQKGHGLVPDGIIGPNTWTALGFTEGSTEIPAGVGVTASGNIPANEKTVDLLISPKIAAPIVTSKVTSVLRSGILYIAIAAIAVLYYMYENR